MNSDSAEAYCSRGAAFHYLEDYRSAKKDLNRAIDINPKYQQAYYYLTAADLSLENYHQAIENCDRAIEIDHRYSYAYLIKGKAYLGLNNFQAAIDNCDREAYPKGNRALELNHNLLEGCFIRGAAHCDSGDHQTAMFNFYRKSILEPSVGNYYNLAAIQFTQGMYSDALKSFNSCLKSDNRLKFAYYGRANIHFEFNNPELALQDFNTATDIEAITEDKSHLNDEHGYYVRGLAKYLIGENLTQALKDLEQAKEIAAKHQDKDLEDKAISVINDIRNK
ncbi:MAG: tetratricopeptide repeat protein [Cyanobacteria bacterium P01_G01_bin.39]